MSKLVPLEQVAAQDRYLAELTRNAARPMRKEHFTIVRLTRHATAHPEKRPPEAELEAALTYVAAFVRALEPDNLQRFSSFVDRVE